MKKSRRFAVVALLVAVAAFVVIASGQIGRNLVYYWGPKDLKAAGEKAIGATIRLGGMVVPGSVKKEDGGPGLRFEVTDNEATVRVHSTGVPPQMFREGIGVVVEGTMTREGIFESTRLMVSHGNEYRAPGEGHKGDIKALIKDARPEAPAR